MFWQYQSSKKLCFFQERMKTSQRIVNLFTTVSPESGRTEIETDTCTQKYRPVFFGTGMFYWNSCRSFFSLPGSHQVVILTAHGPTHSPRFLMIVDLVKTSKKYFCRMFSDFLEGSCSMADEKVGKHAAKVFFGCFGAPTHFDFRSFFWLCGRDKISKKYFCRMFSVCWTLFRKLRSMWKMTVYSFS